MTLKSTEFILFLWTVNAKFDEAIQTWPSEQTIYTPRGHLWVPKTADIIFDFSICYV